MIAPKLLYAVLVVVAVSTTGCTIGDWPPSQSTLALAHQAAQDQDEYKIGPEDILDVSVWKNEYALDNNLTLKAAALKLGFVTEDEFDRVVDPAKMVKSYVATDK
jgi:Fumarase C C-terminus